MKFNPTCWALVRAYFEPLNPTSPAWRGKLDSKLQQVSLLSLGVSQKEIKEVLSRAAVNRLGTRGLLIKQTFIGAKMTLGSPHPES